MRRELTGWLFVSPWLLGFCLLVLYPFAASLLWSFCYYDLLSPPRFAGTVHYERLLDKAGSSRFQEWGGHPDWVGRDCAMK